MAPHSEAQSLWLKYSGSAMTAPSLPLKASTQTSSFPSHNMSCA
jgi:hypothetical protein